MGDDDQDFEQLKLFDLPAGKAARDAAMAQVEEHATPGWSTAMYALVVEVAREKPTFNADDVFELALARGIYHGTHDRRAFGPVMRDAADNLVCRKSTVPAKLCRRKSRHGAPLTTWVSLIWGQR